MPERALQDLESHLANAHDIELRLLNHSQDSSLFHDKRFRCFTRVSWIDDDTWQCGGVELELHLGARIEKRKWNLTAMDAYDSLIARGLDCILPTFRAQGTPLLLSAEANCFPASPGQTIHDYGLANQVPVPQFRRIYGPHRLPSATYEGLEGAAMRG
jgi:hypothetical protein